MSMRSGAAGARAQADNPRPSTSRSKLPAKCGPSKSKTEKRGAGKPQAAKVQAGKPQAAKSQTAKAPPPTRGPDLEQFPAFSLGLPPSMLQEQQKEKVKMMRRNKPKGEDLKKMAKIVETAKQAYPNVHEFVGLIAPSTGDDGKVMRLAVADEMNAFRNATRKIYETMTEDVSDVLINEQIQLKEFTASRNTSNEEKIQRMMNEILMYIPDFTFEDFYEKEDYLETALPVAQTNTDHEEMEAILRQEAYHRYLWLKSEGLRLRQENIRLQKRLKELKKKQTEDLQAVTKKEEEAEEKRQILEATQELLEERLEELNESVAKSLLKAEEAEAEPISLKPLPKKPNISEKIKALKGKRPKPPWAAQQAAEIEATTAREALQAETSKISIKAKAAKSKSGIRKLKKSAQSQPPPQESSPFHYSPVKSPTAATSQAGVTSPFHFSPIKTPPAATSQARAASPFHFSPIKTPPAAMSQARAASPFHFSPIKTPPAAMSQARAASPFHFSPIKTPSRTEAPAGQSPFHHSPPRSPAMAPRNVSHMQPVRDTGLGQSAAAEPNTMNISTSQVVTERQLEQRGRARAPRDTWGGFY